MIGTGYSKERQIPLHTVFLNPHIFYEKGFDLLLRGLVREKAQSVDSYITDEVSYAIFFSLLYIKLHFVKSFIFS